MATTVIVPLNPITTTATANNSNSRKPRHRKPRRVCFSFAAYAKIVIDNLKACNVPVAEGLSDEEFTAVESTFNFTFPPDLRSILQEGLPVGPSFPNWRSSSPQQLEILSNFPILGICKEVSRHNFWVESWGEKPQDHDEAVKLAKGFLKKAPVLVPIYRHCYIPSKPNLAGNPVFYVHGVDFQLSSFDVAGFFQQADFGFKEGLKRRASLSNLLNAPAWAATEARRIEFWTEMVERGERAAAIVGTRWWRSRDVEGCLEDVCWRLKDGGWKEEEVREMMIMDGGGEESSDRKGHAQALRNREGVVRQVRVLSLTLLRAGWSTEDVVDSLGCHVENGSPPPDVESWLDFQHGGKSCLPEAI